MVDFKNAAMTYCKYRIPIGSLITIFTALMIFITVRLPKTQQPYVKGTNVDGIITYVVQGQAYVATRPNVRGPYPYVLYDPTNPSDARVISRHPDTPSGMGGILVCLACLMILCAVLAFYLRANPIFCGVTIASNTLGLFSP